MSNCLPCTDPIAPCRGCKKTQICQQISRSCTQCPRNICVDSDSSSKSSGGVSTGATAGATVGGVVGVAALIGLVYWFWWRPKGLAASRKRYSQHLMNRQSKLEKRKTANGLPSAAHSGAGNEAGDVATKRTSVHVRMDDADAHNRRGNGQTGNLLDETVPVSRSSEDDNPFGDQNRSSIGTFGTNDDAASTHTSEFSFRSSHSTNIIPIAYIPPHSSSLSVDDAQGRAQPQRNMSPSPTIPRRSTMNRVSIPTSMASRDSLALAGAEIIELHPLPPVLTPDTPSIPHGTTANGAPIRPPRSPGLDLQLPKTSSPLASPPINSPHLMQTSPSSSARFSRPPSGFPFSNANSSSSGSPTSPTYPHHQLLPPPSPAGGSSRGMSVLGEQRAGSSQSHLSVMSSFTSRSANSTMSYILDPPQIITPVNAQGVKRVEFQQAKAHKLGGGGGAGANGTNLSPTSPLALHDPFSDEASINRGGETGSSSRPVSTSSRWTSTSSLVSDDASSESVQFLQGQSITFTNPNTPSSAATAIPSRVPHSGGVGQGAGGSRGVSGLSAISVDLPRSARSSQSYSIADEDGSAQPGANRQSTWSSTSESNTGGLSSHGMSRTSTTSSTSHDSLLAGIPFLAPSIAAGTGGGSNASLPINVTNGPTRDFETPRAPTSSRDSGTTPRDSLARSTTSYLSSQSDDETQDPLPAPFLPFAGQRPTSIPSPTKDSSSRAGGGERVQSEHFSVRSGFGSGLSQIPFQLGFPSGFGEGEDETEDSRMSDRASMLSSVTNQDAGSRSARWSEATSAAGAPTRAEEAVDEDEEGHDSGLSNIEERTEVGSSAAPSRRESVKSEVNGGLDSAGQHGSVLPTPPASPPRLAPSNHARTEATAEEHDEEETNPFGSHAEVDNGADPRASMDTLALSAALSANLDAQA